MSVLLIAWLLAGPTPDPNQPTVPPPLPTYVVRDDGTRVACAPNFTTCDWSQPRG